jgi:hypothetical protein
MLKNIFFFGCEENHVFFLMSMQASISLNFNREKTNRSMEKEEYYSRAISLSAEVPASWLSPYLTSVF